MILVSLTPHGLRLRLHAIGSRIGSNGTVKHAERTLNLCREVDVSRSVNQVNLIDIAVPSPVTCCGSRGNGDTSLLLLNHPVHRSCTIVHLTNLVGQSGVVQDTFRRGGLAGIDVRHDADISCQV